MPRKRAKKTTKKAAKKTAKKTSKSVSKNRDGVLGSVSKLPVIGIVVANA
jgi:hypothetical protein